MEGADHAAPRYAAGKGLFMFNLSIQWRPTLAVAFRQILPLRNSTR